MGLLNGKVMLITGAGGGIGRAHALACAKAGAKIVVNDLGGARDGTGVGRSMADQVVDEIRASGGEAIANHDSVTDVDGCARMVEAAMLRWGRLDAVVNNAGILRDKTFSKMTDIEWDIVVAVHLTGTRNVTRAALPALSKQGGAIVNTTSYSGMIGNFGQSNYAAAKAGIYGFTRVLSMELRKLGITVNCVAPIAKTRMTEDVGMVAEEWTPDQISPVVVFLASDLAKSVTGQVFGVQGQRIHLYEVKTNEGVEKPGVERWTAEEIAEHLPEICCWSSDTPVVAEKEDLVSKVFSFFPAGFTKNTTGWSAVIHWQVGDGIDQTLTIDSRGATVQTGLQGSPTCTVKVDKSTLVSMLTGELEPQKAFMSGKALADNMSDLMKMASAFDFKKIAAAFGGKMSSEASIPTPEAPRDSSVGKRYEGGFWFIDRNEFQAYAAATDDKNPAYEGDQAVAPPMYHVRPFIGLMMKLAGDPELELDMLRLVHGEHEMQFHRVLKHGDLLQLRATLLSLEEKSSGRVAVFGLYGFIEGELALEGKTTYFVRGAKKPDASAEKKPAAPVEPPPAPDREINQVVTEDQATRYAFASGDNNPIHTSQETAKAAGLPGVILHGLCTMALAQRDLIREFAGGDPARLRHISVRFARPVFPGQLLKLKVWQQGNVLQFQTENSEGQVVIANGRAEIS